MREFDTGATRDDDDTKYDYEGFLSPVVLRRYAEYMHRHREQSDGKLRPGDNWQRGIPDDAYMKSMWRHFMSVWLIHRIHRGSDDRGSGEGSYGDDMEEALCALLFNVMGYLFNRVGIL